jgi:hypothetical protein
MAEPRRLRQLRIGTYLQVRENRSASSCVRCCRTYDIWLRVRTEPKLPELVALATQKCGSLSNVGLLLRHHRLHMAIYVQSREIRKSIKISASLHVKVHWRALSASTAIPEVNRTSISEPLFKLQRREAQSSGHAYTFCHQIHRLRVVSVR